jgi:alkanesulfonate monooxygenase SsuD/methylene tetrahydromethanopterin reductase-like flavin-dependent oxidoreductase (luciferase family)
MRDLLTTAIKAEGLGFGYLFRSDHLLPTDNRRGIDSPECWTSLGAISASTKRIKFGPMVTPVGFRNPALLARMACSLHSLSEGRLQLALGIGWYEPEYRSNGYGFPAFKVRKEQFEEGLAVVLSMLREGRVDFDGKHYSAHTDCLPRPSGRVHLILGGRGKSIVRAAAQKADEWNTLVSTLEDFRKVKALLDARVMDRQVVISEMGPFLLGRSQGELEANATRQLQKLGQPGSPSDLVKRLKSRGAFCGTRDEFSQLVSEKQRAGITKFYFQALVPENEAMIELLADWIRSMS